MTFAPKLNLPQRILLAAAGVVILAIAIDQMVDYGLEGSGWVVPIVVAVVLMLPLMGIRKEQSVAPKSSPMASNAPASSRAGTSEKPSTQMLTAQVQQLAATLASKLPEWVGTPALPELEHVNDFIIGSWRVSCQAYCFALVCAVEARKDRHFLNGDREKALALAVLQMMLDGTRELLSRQPVEGLFNRKAALESLTKDLAEASVALRAFITRVATSQPTPDKPLIDYLSRKISITAGRERLFEDRLRGFTQDALRSLAAT